MIPVQGPCIGSGVSVKNCDYGHVLYRLGSGHRGPVNQRSVERASYFVAHQLSGDDGCVSGPETLSTRPQGPSHSYSNRQNIGGINQQGGLRSHPLCRLVHQVLLWSQVKLLSPKIWEQAGSEAPGNGDSTLRRWS